MIKRKKREKEMNETFVVFTTIERVIIIAVETAMWQTFGFIFKFIT